MTALRRILLCVWGLISTAIAVIMTIMLVNSSFAAGVYGFLDKYVMYNLHLAFFEDTGIWWIILFGAVLLVLGVFCIIVALMPKAAPKKLRIASVDGGCVDMSLSALHHIVQRAAVSCNGVSSAKSHLAVKNNGLYVTLNIQVPDNISITETGAAVQEAVKNQLDMVAGIIPADVQVIVEDVTENKEVAAHGN